MMELILQLKSIALLVIRGYYYLVIANVILSWVRPDPGNPVVRFIRGATEPVFRFARRSLPFLVAGAIDFSPIAVILLLELLAQVVGKVFDQLAISAA